MDNNRNCRTIEFFLSKIEQVEFGSIAFQLSQKLGWSQPKISQEIANYIAILALAFLCPNGSKIVPNKNADEILHLHLADAVKWQQDCHLIFGTILQHKVGQDNEFKAKAFFETQKLLSLHFNVNAKDDNDRAACHLTTQRLEQQDSPKLVLKIDPVDLFKDRIV